MVDIRGGNVGASGALEAMADHDQVADVFNRHSELTETQDACRDRVRWLCQQVGGRRVLDIGCSQGDMALLLAREGHEVIGLDLQPEPLSAAERALANESQPVQQRVQFILGDAHTHEFEPASFDSVILGDLLERLANPDRLLERVDCWLRPGGRLVVSVPHGYHPQDDHRRSFYFGTLIELLGQHFTVDDVDLVADQSLCAVASKPAAGEQPQLPSFAALREWERRCEGGVERLQRRGHADRLARQQERQTFDSRVAELHSSFERQKKAEEELRNQLRERESSTQQQLDATRQRAEYAAQRARHLSQRLRELESSEARLRSLYESEKRMRIDLQQQVQTLRQKLARTQELHAGEKRLRQQSLAQLNQLKTESKRYKQELARLEQGVRYRLGDAFVRAAKPSTDTLKLPFRLLALAVEGLKRVRARRQERAAARQADSKQPKGTTAQSQPPTFTALDGIAALCQPFASTPPELRRRDDLRVALVADEFSWRAWQFEADMCTFTPQTWQEVLEERKPDCVLIESTWSGLNDSWYFQLRDLGKRGEVIKYYAVPDVVAWCRKHGVPTVFYNKEDPPHFDVFIDAARQFDYVFTSDANCIGDYRKHLVHERIFALPFAAQPRIHNPMMTGTRTGSVCFAGTWHAHRHLGRQEGAEQILRPALDFDLHIFDRMANSENPNYRWPDEYLPALRGSLPYAQMLAAYKRYKVFLNVNSVQNSPTMFARRVFELLACGTPVISSFSEGIAELLPDVVSMSDDAETTRKLLERLLGDDEYRERLALRGQRKVLSEHTYTHRLQMVLDTIGLKRPQVGCPQLTVLAAVETADQLAAVWANYRRQVYKHKRLVVCARESSAVASIGNLTAGDESVQVVLADGALWGQVLAEAVKSCQDGFILAWHPADYYGEHYLTDYANATLYVTEPAFGKATYYQSRGGEVKPTKSAGEYRVTSQVHPWTLCLSHKTATEAAISLSSAQTPAEWWTRLARQFPRHYATDRFNYVQQMDEQAGPIPPGAVKSAVV